MKEPIVASYADLMYDSWAYLSDVRDMLTTAAEQDYATHDDELTPIIDLVCQALLQMRQFDVVKEWLE